MRGVRGLVAPVLIALAGGAQAQETSRPPVEGGRTESLGRPATLHRFVGIGGGFVFGAAGTDLVGEARYGLFQHLFNPLLGFLDVRGEIYAGARGPKPDWGARTQLFSPYLRLGVGVDYNGPDEDLYFMLSAAHPVRRGGILGYGSQLRANFIPGRHGAVTLAVEVPIGSREHAGRTRPRNSALRLEEPVLPPVPAIVPDPGVQTAIAEAREAALWIARGTVPFLQYGPLVDGSEDRRAMRDMTALRDHYGSGGGPVDDVLRFHDALERAFSGAADAGADTTCTEDGRAVADIARTILLDEVLAPYDRLLGRARKNDSVLGFGRRARGVFVRRLRTDPRIDPRQIQLHQWVFTRLIDIVEAVRIEQRHRWGDGRRVWLPLQLAMRPDEHDSQAELDALVERVMGTGFTDGNRVWYVVNEQFPLQLSRTIHAAEEYHVLWVHDVRGRDASGDPDEMTFRYTVSAYLAALTRRVSEYDRTGTLPVYMIFHDQWFFEVNDNRFWIDLLGDPLRHRLRLPKGFEAWEDSVEAAQDRLRDAVAESRLLQDQAAVFGQQWLRNLVRVHVSVTNPADPTFWTQDLVPIWGMPDNLMRDHRKIAFYDVTEDDPYRGGAIYTGAGVGEHYATPSWEDRSVLAEGPVLLSLRNAARELLIQQGIPAERVPWVLQPRPIGPEWADRVAAYRDTAFASVRALEAHNATGYAQKDASVLRAVLYSMMPAGSVAIVPDPLWTSTFWGGLLVGQALRGGRTLIIVPAPSHAPSTIMGSMALVRETQSRVLLAASILAPTIDAAGGLLRVGVYRPDFDPLDLAAKLGAFRTSLDSLPWFRDLYGLDPEVPREIDRLGAHVHATPSMPQTHFEDGPARLHLKAVFLASREAWDGLFSRKEWPDVLRAFVAQRAWQIENREHALGHLDAPFPDVLEVGKPMIDAWLASLSPAERDRVVVYLMVGSQNHDERAFALDGEAVFVTAGSWINAGLIDLVSFTGQADWASTPEELATLLPAPSVWQLRWARWLRPVL